VGLVAFLDRGEQEQGAAYVHLSKTAARRTKGRQIFGQAAARTGLRDHQATAAGFDPVSTETAADAGQPRGRYPAGHPGPDQERQLSVTS
jgi:hypothetical protein